MDIGFYYSVVVTLLALFFMFRSYRANSQLETMVDYYKLRMKDREHEAQQRVLDVQAGYDRRLKEAEEACRAQEAVHQAELRGLRKIFEGLKTSTWDEANKLWVTVSPDSIPRAPASGTHPDPVFKHVSDPKLATKPEDLPVPGVPPVELPRKILRELAVGDPIGVAGVWYEFKGMRVGQYALATADGEELIFTLDELLSKGYELR